MIKIRSYRLITKTIVYTHHHNDQLVDAARLLEILFDERSRPSLRWLREQQRRRTIPYIKIGHLVRFNPAQVREALEERNTIVPR